LRNWGATIYAHADPAAGFKNCCMSSGKFDGSRRQHFFPRVKSYQTGQLIVALFAFYGQSFRERPLWTAAATAGMLCP